MDRSCYPQPVRAYRGDSYASAARASPGRRGNPRGWPCFRYRHFSSRSALQRLRGHRAGRRHHSREWALHASGLERKRGAVRNGWRACLARGAGTTRGWRLARCRALFRERRPLRQVQVSPRRRRRRALGDAEGCRRGLGVVGLPHCRHRQRGHAGGWCFDGSRHGPGCSCPDRNRLHRLHRRRRNAWLARRPHSHNPG